MPDQVIVEFDVDAEPKDGSGNRYVAGQRVPMSRGSADHWIRRRKAHEVEAAAGAITRDSSELPTTPKTRRQLARRPHGKHIVAGNSAGAAQGVSDDG